MLVACLGNDGEDAYRRHDPGDDHSAEQAFSSC